MHDTSKEVICTRFAHRHGLPVPYVFSYSPISRIAPFARRAPKPSYIAMGYTPGVRSSAAGFFHPSSVKLGAVPKRIMYTCAMSGHLQRAVTITYIMSGEFPGGKDDNGACTNRHLDTRNFSCQDGRKRSLRRWEEKPPRATPQRVNSTMGSVSGCQELS